VDSVVLPPPTPAAPQLRSIIADRSGCNSALWQERTWLNWPEQEYRAQGKQSPQEGFTMKNVAQLLEGKGREVHTIGPDARVIDALKLMAEKDVGALIVTEGGKLAGIISERDYARKVILHGKSSHDIAVREIMTSKLVTVQPRQTVEECMALMTSKRIRHLPVIEGERLVGVLSIGDLVKEVIAEQEATIKQLESYIHS
jgi:CBS domain-containing protein